MDSDPLEGLKDAFHSDEIEIVLQGIKNMKIVADAIGPKRIEQELIPFLKEEAGENEDEALKEMATVLGTLCSSVGGSSNSICLLGPLKILASQEETVVREEAVASIKKIIQELLPRDVMSEVLPLLQELTDGDWFTSRISACGIFADAYKKLESDEEKGKITEFYRVLCNDDTPMVRRAAANNLGSLAAVMDENAITVELLPLFKLLVGDDQDSVRLISIEKCKDLAHALSQEKNVDYLLPIIRSCAEDKSWKVRQSIAKDFADLAKCVGVEKANSDLLPYLLNFLNDPEGDVRCVAVKNTKGFFDLLGPDALKKLEIFDFLSRLSTGPYVNVKSALADTCMQLSGKVPKDVIGIIQTLLNDDLPDVRITILSQLNSLVQSGDVDCLKTLLPEVIKLHTDKQWRVRESIASQMTGFAKALGLDYFNTNLLNIFLSLLEDQVNAVRSKVTQSIGELNSVFGSQWIVSKVTPALVGLFHRSADFYLKRETVLFAVQSLAKSLPAAVESSSPLEPFLPLLVQSADDAVPNVRMLTAQAWALVAPKCSQDYRKKTIVPKLTALCEDKDREVKYYAALTLETIGSS